MKTRFLTSVKKIFGMKRPFLTLVAALMAASFFAQKPAHLGEISAKDSVTVAPKNLLQAFQNGHFHGHFRGYFMATDNAKGLSDYHALAAGGGLHFSTAAWHGFSFGIGGLFNYNLFSSDLSKKDSLTGASNRYEIGLFDVQNPENRNDLDRIEELWLKYHFKKTSIRVGQQSVQTPFINYQDGRMRPTAEAGAWLENEGLKSTKIEAGYFWKISPRSTVDWYGVGESIGLYPKGLNPDGTGSGYPENLESMGIGLLGVTRNWGQRAKIQVWDQFVENIFNTTFAQADYSQPLKNGQKLFFGLQFTHQFALADGGNADPSKSYFQKNGKSNVISAQAGWQRGPWQAIVAFTRTTGDGRFLSPREWGREPFFTFMQRERIEGSGDTHAFSARANWQNRAKKLRIEAGYARFFLPDVKNAALNKYAFPSFDQFNFDVRYAFGGMFEGLRGQILFVHKGLLGEVYGNKKLIINRVNMSHVNFVLNYTY